MTKYYFIILAFIISFTCFSQSVSIAIQDFDEATPEWNFSTDTPFFDNSSDGFFGIHNGDNDADTNDTGFSLQANSITSSAIENDFLFIHDLNDESENGTNAEATITFANIDVSTYFDVEITFDFEIFEFENFDYIIYEVIEDGIISTSETLVKNGQGLISVFIQNATNNVGLRLIIKQNSEVDYAAIDNLKLVGKPIIPCNDLFISEYIEGTSSINHRNNYIEIYNPTSNSISLENYDLVKYTGNSLTVSNTLTLTGNIPSYGVLLIEDSTENLIVNADISTNSFVMDFTGDDKIALRNSENIIDLIGKIGNSVDYAKDVTLRRKSAIQNANTQFNPDEWDVYELENVKNINQHVSRCSGAIPEIEVTGNFNSISDEATSTSTFNNTYFGAINSNSEEIISKIFTLKNTGNTNLNISGIEIVGINADNFTLDNDLITSILPNDSISFNIAFQTVSSGIKNATIRIHNDDASENPFQFLIQAEGTDISNSPLLISQYYEGDGNDKWLEITNISQSATAPNFFYLALFSNEKAENPVGENPNVKITLPILQPGEVVTYRSTLSPSKPIYALNGNEIATQICRFNGDDILVISTTDDATCWENKIDIIGNSTNWGENKSFVRKYGCNESLPNTGFSLSDWIVFETSEIDNASTGFNYVLGQHFTGNTTFENTNTWNNGFPDIYRDVIIDSNYNTTSYSNFASCNLTINTGSILDIYSNNFITIQSNLSVNGTLNVLHEGSLLMLDNNGLTTNNGDINVHKTTTIIKPYDYTYWSSPVKTAILETVFNASPQNSFYVFNTKNYSDLNDDSFDDDENAWQRVSGQMTAGIGYTAMAPNTNPFLNTQSVIFTGEVNNGIVNVPIYVSANTNSTADDFNLIGNPYPSAIDAVSFLNHTSNATAVEGTIYFWTHNSSVDQNIYSSDDYAVYTVGTGGIMAVSQGQIPTRKIASGQGFLVNAIQDETLIFSNEMRIDNGNNNFFKESNSKEENQKNDTKIWLNLHNDSGAFNQILIGFLEDATDAIEQKFDGLRFDGNSFVSFYSIAENKNLAIQGTKAWQDDMVIPLGFSSKIKEKITLKISIDHIEGKLADKEVYLQDNLLNKIHNLQLEDYVFETEFEGKFDDRFSMRFNQQILNTENTISKTDRLLIKNETDFISVTTRENSKIRTIKIYDILGRIVMNQLVDGNELQISKTIFHQKGVNILHVKLDNSRVLIKKIMP